MKRREFLRTSLTVSTLAGLGAAGLSATAAEAGGANREYYELRIYRLKTGAKSDLLDAYLETAAIPALNRLGIKPVGAFTERDSKEAPAVYVLIPANSVPGKILAGTFVYEARILVDGEGFEPS